LSNKKSGARSMPRPLTALLLSLNSEFRYINYDLQSHPLFKSKRNLQEILLDFRRENETLRNANSIAFNKRPHSRLRIKLQMIRPRVSPAFCRADETLSFERSNLVRLAESCHSIKCVNKALQILLFLGISESCQSLFHLLVENPKTFLQSLMTHCSSFGIEFFCLLYSIPYSNPKSKRLGVFWLSNLSLVNKKSGARY